MRKIICLGIVALLLTFQLQQGNAQTRTMTVKEKSGTESNYPLSQVSKITFSSGDMVVQSVETSSPYTISGLKNLTFSDLISGLQTKKKSASTFVLFPNPAENVLYISLPDAAVFPDDVLVQIASFDGRLVSASTYNANQGLLQINVAGLPSGLYHVILSVGNDVLSERFVKQ